MFDAQAVPTARARARRRTPLESCDVNTMRMCANVPRKQGEASANVCEYFANARELKRTPRDDAKLPCLPSPVVLEPLTTVPVLHEYSIPSVPHRFLEIEK